MPTFTTKLNERGLRTLSAGVPDTWDNLYNFFINRVRDRLHM